MSILSSAYTDFAKNVSSLLWEVGMYKFTGSHFFFLSQICDKFRLTRIMVFLYIFILIFSFNFFSTHVGTKNAPHVEKSWFQNAPYGQILILMLSLLR